MVEGYCKGLGTSIANLNLLVSYDDSCHANSAAKLIGANMGVRLPMVKPSSVYAVGAVSTKSSPNFLVWLTKSVQNAPPWTVSVTGRSRIRGMRRKRKSCRSKS